MGGDIAAAAQICGLSDRYRNLVMVSVGTSELHALTKRRMAIRQVLENSDALFEVGEKVAEDDFSVHLNALLSVPAPREAAAATAEKAKMNVTKEPVKK